MVVNIHELEIIFSLAIKKLRTDEFKHVEIDIDNYWIILTDEWSNLNKLPNPAVGSLSEDIEYLKRSINENEIFSYSDFDRLASLLRFISEKLAPSN